jgi:hypothetical protein
MRYVVQGQQHRLITLKQMGFHENTITNINSNSRMQANITEAVQTHNQIKDSNFPQNIVTLYLRGIDFRKSNS